MILGQPNITFSAENVSVSRIKELVQSLPLDNKIYLLLNPFYSCKKNEIATLRPQLKFNFLDCLDNSDSTISEKDYFQDERDFQEVNDKFDHIIIFECFHFSVMPEKLAFIFAEKLANTGSLTIMNIPNKSKLDRRLKGNSESFYRNNFLSRPFKSFDQFQIIDDPLLIGLILRFRAYGFESYLRPSSYPYCDNLEFIKKIN